MMSIGMVMLAPAVKASGKIELSTVEVIIGIIAVIGIVGIIGWRSPDRSPGAENKRERDD